MPIYLTIHIYCKANQKQSKHIKNHVESGFSPLNFLTLIVSLPGIIYYTYYKH